jgi:hypothetical protein
MRRSSRQAAVANRISRDPATFASLPLPLAQRIFLALPVIARGRASCVCRAWRDTLAEPSLWTRLDMSVVPAEGLRLEAVLRGAARRVRGQLRQLNLSQKLVTSEVLLPVLTGNAGSLRELHLHMVSADSGVDLHADTVQGVLAVVPLLQVLKAVTVFCKWEDAPRVLRAEAPYAPLQLSGSLKVRFEGAGFRVGGMERVGPFAAALADAALQPSLLRLDIRCADTAQPALMGALVDAALARRLPELALDCCTPPAAVPLARLLAEGSLAVLELYPSSTFAPMFDAAGAALIANSLRMTTTLRKLYMCCTGLCRDMRVAGALLGALVGHPSLRELYCNEENPNAEDRRAFGAALAALISADAPALQVLVCYENSLRKAGLAPIVEALALNRHLRELDLRDNGMREAFAREQLLPAVRANTTLQKLRCGTHETGPGVAGAEAQELVRGRGQRD